LPARPLEPSAVRPRLAARDQVDGYRVIARKDGDQVRLWARTTSDYSKAFTRITDTVAVDSAVLNGEAVALRGVFALRDGVTEEEFYRDCTCPYR
jgi:hypothetical protein